MDRDFVDCGVRDLVVSAILDAQCADFCSANEITKSAWFSLPGAPKSQTTLEHKREKLISPEPSACLPLRVGDALCDIMMTPAPTVPIIVDVEQLAQRLSRNFNVFGLLPNYTLRKVEKDSHDRLQWVVSKRTDQRSIHDLSKEYTYRNAENFAPGFHKVTAQRLFYKAQRTGCSEQLNCTLAHLCSLFMVTAGFHFVYRGRLITTVWKLYGRVPDASNPIMVENGNVIGCLRESDGHCWTGIHTDHHGLVCLDLAATQFDIFDGVTEKAPLFVDACGDDTKIDKRYVLRKMETMNYMSSLVTSVASVASAFVLSDFSARKNGHLSDLYEQSRQLWSATWTPYCKLLGQESRDLLPAAPMLFANNSFDQSDAYKNAQRVVKKK